LWHERSFSCVFACLPAAGGGAAGAAGGGAAGKWVWKYGRKEGRQREGFCFFRFWIDLDFLSLLVFLIASYCFILINFYETGYSVVLLL